MFLLGECSLVSDAHFSFAPITNPQVHGLNDFHLFADCFYALSFIFSYSGEGLFMTTFTGPGVVWLQGQPPQRMVSEIARRVPSGGVGLGIPIGGGGGGGGEEGGGEEEK